MNLVIVLFSLVLSSLANAQTHGDVSLTTDKLVNKAMLIQIRGAAATEMYQNLQVQEETAANNPKLGTFKVGHNVVCYLGDGSNTVCSLDVGFDGAAAVKR